MLLTVLRKLSVGISSVYLFRNLYGLRAPRRGARFSARERESAGVLQNRSYRRNPPPMPVQPPPLRSAAPDAGLRAYLKPKFLQSRRCLMVMYANRSIMCKMRSFYGGRPLVAPTKSGEIGAQRLRLNHSEIRSICTPCSPISLSGRPVVARPSSISQTKPRTHFRKRKTPVFAQAFIRRERPYL